MIPSINKKSMRLLILTQKVDQNDDVLGFFHGWIAEFAKHCEQVTVIALGVGEYHLPKNVRVFSLGKERGVSRLSYLFSFYRLIWRERKNYDVVFVHMNPVYVILGGLLWRAWKKNIGLWYTHKHVDMKLRIAEKLSHTIFTASSESFRLMSNKIKVVGHGINIETFKPTEKRGNEVFRIVTAGRISPVKDYQTLIEAVAIIVQDHISVKVDIVGGPATAADKDYLEVLRALVHKKNLEQVIRFVGSVPNKELPVYLERADIFVNMSRTGSLDKAVLEAMASGVPVVTSNEALREVLGPDAQSLMFTTGSANECSERIKSVQALSLAERRILAGRLHDVVEKEHNSKMLIPRILDILV